jgi:hypothetical protein
MHMSGKDTIWNYKYTRNNNNTSLLELLIEFMRCTFMKREDFLTNIKTLNMETLTLPLSWLDSEATMKEEIYA